jgi:hypothetical protein
MEYVMSYPWILTAMGSVKAMSLRKIQKWRKYMDILSKEFQDEVAEKLKISDVLVSIHDNLSKQHFYYQLYIECKRELIRLEGIVDAKYQELLHYYKFEYDFQLTNQKELEKYIINNEGYRKLNKVLQLKKLEEEVLTEVVTMFKNRAFTINNILKYQELERK